MKNVLKARIAPLCGIIAMIAVIGFMTGCGGEEEPAPAPTGRVSIEASEYGAFVDYPLEAKYTGSDAGVGVVWILEADKTDFETSTSATDAADYLQGVDAIFKPSTAGTYIAGLVNIDALEAWFEDETGKLTMPGFTWSSGVVVAAKPAHYRAFGTWKTKEQFTVANTTTKADETLFINDKVFKVDSTYQNELIYWNITNWEDVSSNFTSYDFAYKLTVSMYDNRGYTAYTAFNIYLDGSVVMLQRTQNLPASGTPTIVSRGTGYEQIVKPETSK